MVALSSDYMVPREPTEDSVQEQLQSEIISLRRKLTEERKRNHELQEIVVRGMEKMLQGRHCTCACASEQQKVQVNLGGDVYIPALKWQHLMGQPKDSLFVREAAKVIWGVKNLYNRSITGAPCRRYLYKEGGPFGGATEKRALTPTKMDALRSEPSSCTL
ncbi:hypothetical protein HPB50_021420 [Hyalomma asiaticum]|uniref:Uncharacterized protein n=1 Tax=Hyalomma asiaticum TaxID=266040 RepID=A0ACB7RLK7_HYAAI|nr:hypothetical protein HPB50_021420 [Hyalomma asiaticum]